MNIVHYVPGINLEQGGVVRAILDWCSVFARRGHRVTLLTYQGKDIPPEWFAGGSGLPTAILLNEPAAVHRNLLAPAAIRKAQASIAAADVLHLHAPWLNGNLQMAKLARKHRVPYVVTIHGMLDDWSMSQRTLKKRIYLLLLGRRFLDRAACVHCTAQAELDQAKKWFGNPRTAVLPYIVDLSAFENLPGPEIARQKFAPAAATEPKILYLSRLHEKKGVDVLIAAAGILRDRNIPFHLMIAGVAEDDYESQLRRQVESLKLGDRATFLGMVKGVEKVSLYQAADVFVLPTSSENFGLVLIESLACRTPIITTRGTDIWSELQSAGGWIVERSPQVLADKIAESLSDPAARQRGEQGRTWVFENLQEASLAARYEAMYAALPRG